MMVPAAVTGSTVEALGGLVAADDALIDGGNSYYRDDIDRAHRFAGRGVHYVDVGTSGGVWGLERGYCLMIGGEQDVVARFAPIFSSLAPGWQRLPGRLVDQRNRVRPNRVGSTAGRTAPATS